MNIELMLHLERAEDRVVWWAETADVAGFSAAADTLVELRERARAALLEIVGEEPLVLVERLAGLPSDATTDSPVSSEQGRAIVALVGV